MRVQTAGTPKNQTVRWFPWVGGGKQVDAPSETDGRRALIVHQASLLDPEPSGSLPYRRCRNRGRAKMSRWK